MMLTQAQDDSGLALGLSDGDSPCSHSTLGSYEDQVKECI